MTKAGYDTKPTRNDSPEKVANGRIYRRVPIRERLMARIEICPKTECWIWKGPTDKDGYGRVNVGGRRANGGGMRLAHRASYEEFVSPIPSGLVIDHLCKNPACINPKHLEPVTQAINNMRKGKKWNT